MKRRLSRTGAIVVAGALLALPGGGSLPSHLAIAWIAIEAEE